MDLTAEIQNYNRVKELVLEKLVSEGLLNQDDAKEFGERCQVLAYKGKWFSRWFDKNKKATNPNADPNKYYVRIVELNERENEVDKLLRRTSGNYDE